MTKINSDRFGQFDEYAAAVAKRLAAVDRNRLKGGDVQFVAVLHSAIVEALIYGHAHAQGASITAKIIDFDKAAAERAVRETMNAMHPASHKAEAIAECVVSGLNAGFGDFSC